MNSLKNVVAVVALVVTIITGRASASSVPLLVEEGQRVTLVDASTSATRNIGLGSSFQTPDGVFGTASVFTTEGREQVSLHLGLPASAYQVHWVHLNAWSFESNPHVWEGSLSISGIVGRSTPITPHLGMSGASGIGNDAIHQYVSRHALADDGVGSDILVRSWANLVLPEGTRTSYVSFQPRTYPDWNDPTVTRFTLDYELQGTRSGTNLRAFSTSTNVPMSQPIPEPIGLGFLAVGSFLAFRRRRPAR